MSSYTLAPIIGLSVWVVLTLAEQYTDMSEKAFRRLIDAVCAVGVIILILACAFA